MMPTGDSLTLLNANKTKGNLNLLEECFQTFFMYTMMSPTLATSCYPGAFLGA